MDARLTPDEIQRYARHLALKEVGRQGQERLKAARVLLVGAGGLGSPAALYLAAAGVGTLGLVEFDEVDLSNLQRQILHGTRDVGRSKLDSAVEALAELNPEVQVEPYPIRLTSGNALDVVARYDVVIDGSDNFPTRYLVNDACVLTGNPLVYGAILRWEGQVSLFAAPEGPCYRCLFREPPPPELVPTCATAGVFGALPGVVGSLQALEAIKWVLGAGDSLAGRLLLFDALGAAWREVAVRRDPACPVCGDEPTVTELVDYERFCGITPLEAAEDESGESRGDGSTDGPVAAGAAAEGPGPSEDFPHRVSPGELQALLEARDPPLLVDVREGWEWEEGNLGHAGAVHLPLGELTTSLDRIPRDRALVLVCSVGARSAGAASYLRDRGFTRAANLAGGLAAWAREIDPELRVVGA